MKKKIFAVLLIFTTALILTACGKLEDKLVGDWYYISTIDSTSEPSWAMTLYSDGSGKMKYDVWGSEAPFTWSVLDKDTLKIDYTYFYDHQIISDKVTVKNDTMTWNGKTYVKQKS